MCECSQHGECVENICFCDLGWFTGDCSRSLKDEWQEAYYFYLSFFLLIFFLVALYSAILLLNQLQLKS